MKNRGLKHWSWKKKLAALLLPGLLLAFWFCLPRPLFNKPLSVVLEDRSGELLGASIARDGQWRFPPADSVPRKFEACILAFEDKRFFYHPGIDPLAIARAARQNLKAGRVRSGGSTLTMQVVRLAGGGKRSFSTKVLESIRALRLELTHSKETILQLYAAHAPFGTNVVGLEAAAWRYYGRSPQQLSWGEMAALAVLPNAPSLVHPGRNPAALVRKRNRLIDLLEQNGTLSASEARMAKLEPIPGKPLPLPQLAPHLLAQAKRERAAQAAAGSRLQSSIDARLQTQVTSILNQYHKRLLANGVMNMAALVLDLQSGKALAYVGNVYQPGNPDAESFVDIIQARRSPGSTLKPLLYAAMLNEGMLLPNTLIPDVPTQIAGYQPHNYDLGYDGAVSASKALSRSLNVPAVKMLQQYKYERFHDMLGKTGISSLTNPPDFYGLSLILGGCEVSMWELSGVYASMARALLGGQQQISWQKPSYRLQEEPAPTQPGYVLEAPAIWHTFMAMNEVMRPGEELLWEQFSSSQRIAWKTGTSFGFRDAWSLGLTPRFLVTVWAGNADGEGRPGLTGIDAAAPVMFDIFRILPAAGEWFSMPGKGMARVPVCTESGFRASDICSHTEEQWIPKAGLRSAVCPYNRMVHLDRTGSWRVTDRCEEPAAMLHKSWFVLPPSMEYYYKAGNYSYKPLPPFKPGCEDEGGQTAAMELIYPRHKARVYVPLEIDGQRGRVIFSAAHYRPDEVIFWHLDDEYAGSTRDLHQIELQPAPGKHLITLVDQQGNRLTQEFTVLDKEN